jgi:hypothetical protein
LFTYFFPSSALAVCSSREGALDVGGDSVRALTGPPPSDDYYNIEGRIKR